jgi:hypothetical protein
MARLRNALLTGLVFAFLLSEGSPTVLVQSSSASSTSSRIAFEVPAVIDPIHTNGEPDVGIDPFGRVFVSGPTGTGTQRSVWLGSVDRGHTFRVISPGLPPNGITSLVDPPGGGDTDINFDRTGKQYSVWASLECFYVSSCISDRSERGGQRYGSKRHAGESFRTLSAKPTRRVGYNPSS